MDYATLSRAGNRIDSLTESTLEFLAARDRGFCQADDCFLLAEISDTNTSNALCSDHYYQHQGELNRKVIRGSEREL